MPNKASVAPATGRLGILIPGMGAVATTFIAGVEAVKLGLGEPVGSLTQLGTVRLGKRTENRTPKIKDFVPLATLATSSSAAGTSMKTTLTKPPPMPVFSTSRCSTN